MRKTLTLLIPTIKVHSSLRMVFPKLRTKNKEFVVGTKEQHILPHIDMNNRVFIRWGSPYKTSDISTSLDYNSRLSVVRANDKKNSRLILAKAGIPVPRIITSNSKNIKYPLVARPRFHAFGRNFILLKHPKEFTSHYTNHAPQGWYYSQFVDKVQEFRVHVAHGKVLCVLEKQGNKNEIIWNRAQTRHSAVVVEPDQWKILVIQAAVKAVKAIGIDFAGVDVMVDQDGKPYVLELNARPLMYSAPLISDKYAQYFDWLASMDTKRVHFDLMSNKPSDYAFMASES